MVRKSKKPWLIFIGILTVALIAAAVSFIYFPTVTMYSTDAVCFGGSIVSLPLDEKEYESMDHIDSHYEISVTKHWNYVTDISGFVVFDGVKANIVNWQREGENYYCFVQESDVLKLVQVGFNKDFSAVMIIYDNGKYDESQAHPWFGPAKSADELIEVMTYFNFNYANA